MAPKEKATQLVDYFTNTMLGADMYGDYDEATKKCALIAVDEIIESVLPSSDFGGYINKNTVEYWQQVKEEIEKLCIIY